MDDRYDMYPTAFSADYIRLNDGASGWEKILDRHRVEMVLWPREKVLSRLLAADSSWRRAYRDDEAVVYVRR